jgi:hypothetical protein
MEQKTLFTTLIASNKNTNFPDVNKSKGICIEVLIVYILHRATVTDYSGITAPALLLGFTLHNRYASSGGPISL